MSREIINIGTVANDGTGDSLRSGFNKTNSNFQEIYETISNQGNDNFLVNPTKNSIDSASRICWVAGGRTGDPNKIGFSGKPLRTDWTPTDWSNDTTYPSGAAEVGTICGGYDHVMNQIAGTICGGGHNFIKYNANGHSFIGGGSYNIISQGRGFIGAGRANSVNGTSDALSTITGGEFNEIREASYGFIGAGKDNLIATEDYSSILGGLNNKALKSYSAVIGGQANISSGSYALTHGNANDATGSYSVLIGNTNKSVHPYGVVFGQRAIAPAEHSITMGGTQLVENGDSQIVSMVQSVRTTNTTTTSMQDAIPLDNTKITTGTMKILLTAIRDGSSNGNNDNNFQTSHYQGELGFFWNGVSGYFCDASGQTATGTSPTRDLQLIRDNISLSTAPQMRLNTGSLRVNVVGLSGVTINWVAKIDMAMTIVS